jgi:hypothetical protein
MGRQLWWLIQQGCLLIVATDQLIVILVRRYHGRANPDDPILCRQRLILELLPLIQPDVLLRCLCRSLALRVGTIHPVLCELSPLRSLVHVDLLDLALMF